MLLAEWTHQSIECVAACRLVLSECSGTHCPLQFLTGRRRVATGPENVQATVRGFWRRQLLFVVVCLHVKTVNTQYTTCTVVSRLSFCMIKMATTNQQRAQCVLWCAKFECVKRVERELRRFVKDIVYSEKPKNTDALRVKITQAFQQITPHMLRRTWAELRRRYELCRSINANLKQTTPRVVSRKKRSADFEVECPHPVLAVCIDTFVNMGETRKVIMPPPDVRATYSLCELRLRLRSSSTFEKGNTAVYDRP
ncbi:hypothetical protein ANN_09165 [Periplaneta americana]|uniref:MADF domain-containing protein n=1 Tax=Periplaneta americana TaxID=6978 RepID=A0ABQ8TL08_PERAM|nr:hypothetical protein ANN_09165 [Periplaneta americana]